MKYTFKEMLDDAKRAGLTSDKVMMRSVESMSELLCLVKEEHPELYWKFMRENMESCMVIITMKLLRCLMSA